MEELLFGDTVEFWELDSSRYWDLDVTPPSVEPLQHMENPEEIVMMATDMRKKRVEVSLKELGEEDQLRFVAAKDKQGKASPNCTESGQRPRPRSCCDEM